MSVARKHGFRFDHSAALRAARDHAGYSDEERRVLYALIAFADKRGVAKASDEAIAMCADIIAGVEASGGDAVALVEKARRSLGGDS